METEIRQVVIAPGVIADSIARGVRELCLATLPGSSGFARPAEVDRVVASLQLAAARLTQILGQSEQWLDDAIEAGGVGHDLGYNPRDAVDAARRWLSTALADASALARSLDVAHQYTSHLTGIVSPRGDR
jgi:hypothetical protein